MTQECLGEKKAVAEGEGEVKEKIEDLEVMELLERSKEIYKEVIEQRDNFKNEAESLKDDNEKLKSQLLFTEKQRDSSILENKNLKKQIEELADNKREMEKEREKLETEVYKQKELVKSVKGQRWNLLQLIKNTIQKEEVNLEQSSVDAQDGELKTEKNLKALICIKDGNQRLSMKERLEKDFPDIEFEEYEVRMNSSTIPIADIYLLSVLSHSQILFIEKRVPKDQILTIVNPEQSSAALKAWVIYH
jgi:chromosome segregation ATPase